MARGNRQSPFLTRRGNTTRLNISRIPVLTKSPWTITLCSRTNMATFYLTILTSSTPSTLSTTSRSKGWSHRCQLFILMALGRLSTTRRQRITKVGLENRIRLFTRNSRSKLRNSRVARKRRMKGIRISPRKLVSSRTSVSTTPRSSVKCGWWSQSSQVIGQSTTLEEKP